MKKNVSVLLMALLLFQTISSSLLIPIQAITNSDQPSVFTNIAVVNDEGNMLQDDAVAGTNATILVDWSIADLEMEAGSTESFTVPSNLSVDTEQAGVLTFEEEEVGTYLATTDGIVTVELTEEIATYPDANGSFQVKAVVIESTEEVVTEEAPIVTEEEQLPAEETPTDTKQQPQTDDTQADAPTTTDTEQPLTQEEQPVKEETNATTETNSFNMQQAATAVDDGFQLTLDQLTDLNGNAFTQDQLLDPSDEFYLKLAWQLKDGHTYKVGDQVTFTLPNAIAILQEMTGELKDSLDNVVANYTISTDKQVTLTFTDYVMNNSNVTGWLQIVSMLDKENVEVEDGEAIIEPIGDEDQLRIPIIYDQKQTTIEKKGAPNKSYNANEINWEVIINKEKNDLTNATITDLLPEGTTFKEGSLKVTKLKANIDGNIIGDLEEIPVSNATFENGTLSIPLGDIDDPYRIEYVTTVTDEDVTQFVNQASLTADGLDELNTGATVTINRGDPIKKKAAKSYDPKTGIIEWEIEFNYNQKSLTDVTLKDAWTPTGKLELVESSVVFKEMTIDENGNASETGTTGLPNGAEVVKGEDQFEITGITTDKPYKITYQTKVTGRVLDSFDVSNTAGFGEYQTGTGTQIGAYYGSKSVGTINYAEKTIDWRIEINHDEYPMEKIKVEDTLGAGLALDANSISVTIDGQAYHDFTLTEGNPFTIAFPNDFTTDKKIIIDYQTIFVADEVPNQRPTNTAAITWTPEGEDGSITKDITVNTELNDKTKNNHWKSGSYDPSSREITWTIYTNYRENQIGNLIIEDTPLGNQKIVEDSVVVTPLTIDADGSMTEGDALDPSVASVNTNTNSLNVTIGETNQAYKIEYKTSLAGLVDVAINYKNAATIKDGSTNLESIEANVGIAKADRYADKSGVQDGKQVHWKIDVNPGQQLIDNLVLEDSISDNQDYLKDSIHVFEGIVDGNGDVTKGEEVPNSEYEITFGPDNRSFQVVWYNQINDAFVVEYSTLFFAGHNESVSNDYKITGGNIVANDTTEDTSNVTIRQLSSGGATGQAGYLVIDKIDSTYGVPESKLAGAEFELIDAHNGKLLKTATTDSTGQIDFGRLLFGEYILRESGIPTGYVTPNEEQTITINKEYVAGSEESKTILTVDNYKPVYQIDLLKTDDVDENILLAGAEFTLYDADNNVMGTATTDGSGELSFENLPSEGTYYLEETKAPEFYQLNTEKIQVSIGEKEREPIQVTVDNQLVPGKARVQKVDIETGNGLAGTVFHVFNSTGERVDTLTSDADGYAVTKELQPGDYTVKEVTPPHGYHLPADQPSIPFTIAKSDTVETIDVNEKFRNEVKSTNIEITKYDTELPSKFLAGAELELTYVGSDYTIPTQVKTTDSTGKAVFEDLKPGTYEIREINAPTGYILNSVPITVEVTIDDVANGTLVTGSIGNAPYGKVVLTKKDEETDKLLQGAVYQVVDASSEMPINGYQNLTTDAFGQITITGLSRGEYKLQETQAPFGYSIDGDGFTLPFTIDDTSIVTETFTREMTNTIIKGSVKVTKVDGDTSESLQGVEFNLVSDSLVNGATYSGGPFITNENGEFEVTDLTPGTYHLEEIKTLDGYQLPTGAQNVSFQINLANTAHEQTVTVENFKLIDIPITKTWNDNDDAEGTRPGEVTIELRRQVGSGTVETVESLDLSGDATSNEWAHTFTDLEQVDNDGNRYTYSIAESNVPTGYEAKVNGYNITNTRAENKDIKIEKAWLDENDTARPVSISVTLLRNGQEVRSEALTKANNWSYTFEDMPLYNNSGVAYTYSVEESDVAGYQLQGIEETEEGFQITNVRSEKTSIAVTKEWKDNPETEARPESITVQLFKNDDTEAFDTQVIEPDTDGNWAYTFANLEKFDENGHLIDYRVEEENVPGYATEVVETAENQSFTITNTRSNTIAVSGKKTWLDDNSEERPTEITVQLTREGDDVFLQEKTVKASDNWEYEFNNLPEFDDNGNKYTYIIDEVDVSGYDKAVNGYDITNTRTGKINISGTKTWKDEQSTADRPNQIEVILKQNGNEYLTQDVDADDNWSYEFTDLPQYDDEGVLYQYTIDETPVAGYKKVVDGYDITNIRSEQTSIHVDKVWMDDNNATNKRPDQITVELYRSDDTSNAYRTKVIRADNGWEYTFDNLEVYDDEGKPYTYEVRELPVEGYRTVVSDTDNDVQITNIRTGKTSVSVTKQWNDNNNADDTRPEEIEIELYRSDNSTEPIDRFLVSANDDGEWKHTFKDLEAFDDQGVAYKYTVDEVTPTGYRLAATTGNMTDGYILTNVQQTSVDVQKAWLDNGDTDARPESITVELHRNGEWYKEQTIDAEDGWKHTFDQLDLYDENGIPYAYTVKEKEVPEGYALKSITGDQETGYEITNLRVGVTEVTGMKTWKDEDASDRPTDGITINLLQDNVVIDTETISATGDGNFSFTELPKYDDQGVPYVYTVAEQEVPGYQSDVKAFDITNTRSEKRGITVTKGWQDEGTSDRPDFVTVYLYQNGTKIDEENLKAEDNWQYTFTDLEAYDEDGIAYTYSVKEEPVDGYKTTIDGFNITNTRIGKTEVSGTKNWLDDESEERPKVITVQLLQNGTVIDTVEVTAEDDWKYQFENLEKYDEKGISYTYTVSEEPVEGYTPKIGGYDITNVRSGTTSVDVTKTWLDGTDEARPSQITVQLYRDGVWIKDDQLSEENDWQTTFDSLPKYNELGEEYTYTIQELSVDGYESTIDGYDITNVRVGKTEVVGTKTWLDDNAEDRPKEITVYLLQNGERIDSTTVTAESNWVYSFTNLEAFDAEGVAYQYTVEEKAIEGYQATVKGYDITNLRVGTVEIAGTKTWLDNNAEDRPEEITVYLLQNGERIDSTKVKATDDWKYRFTDIPQYNDNGVAYTYTVEEEAVEGYETTIDGYDITNVRVGKTEVVGTKTWLDDNADSRPKVIKVNLLQNSVVVDTIEVTADTNWQYHFSDLDAFDENGVRYHYTVKEHAVPGYQSEVNGYDITNTRTAKTSIEVTKAWLDDNSPDRPDSITIMLLQNGKPFLTKEITAKDNWTYTFEDLEAYDEEGRAITYTVEEKPVEGYQTIINGLDITNLRIGTTDVSGQKTWKNDSEANRPEYIEVVLYQNGVEYQTKKVTSHDDWKFSFDDLPKFDEEGVVYVYTIQEKEVEGYESSVEGYHITNTWIGEDVQETPVSSDEQSPNDDGPLPNTATNIFNMLLVGGSAILIGFVLLLVYRKRNA
ncbi:Cna B-type domain-containing protein [Gracilibacillus marinus]|uniref:Cna B-type domain-containing protein n=1 Tax=Gracilibacillus marinus TaxID=630535 RepID=A0ABV8VS82_9BACI